MRIRKNRSELEDKVSQLWEELAFRDGGFASRPVSREVAIQNEVDRQTEWESIYNLAYVVEFGRLEAEPLQRFREADGITRWQLAASTLPRN